MNLLLLLIFNISIIFSAEIEIDTNIKHQTFQGWETGLSIVSHPGDILGTDTTYKYLTNDLMDIMVDSIGVTRCRIEFRSGVENTNDNWKDMIDGKITYDEWKPLRYLTINDNDDPKDLNMDGFQFSELDNKLEVGLLPLKNKLKEKGQDLYINLCYVAFTGSLAAEDYIQNDPDEYAEVVLAAFKHLDEKYGFVPNALEVILEPDVAKFGGGKLVGECMVAAGDLLKENGYTPEFIALSNTNLNNALNDYYLNQFLSVPRVLEYWKEFSYHLYTGRTDENFMKVADLGKQFNVRTSMIEYWSLGHKYDLIHKSLKLANNSAYQYLSSIAAPSQNSDHYSYNHVNFSSPDDYNITIKTRTKYAAQYIKNIRPGDTRIEATSTDVDVDPLAFIKPDGRVLLITMCSKNTKISFKNLDPGVYKVHFTSGNGSTTLNNFEKEIFNGSISEGENLNIDAIANSIIVLEQISQISSISEIENSINIYPNPTKNIFNLEFNSSSIELYNIKLYDLNGNIIQNLNNGYSSSGLNIIEIDLTNFSNGTYIMKIELGKEVISRKVIKN